MDWTAVARGGSPDNDAFLALDPAQRSVEIDAAIEAAAALQIRSPAGCRNIVGAALHFMDAYGIEDQVRRVTLTFLLGSAFLRSEDLDNAQYHFKLVLRYPAEAQLAEVLNAARINYAGILAKTDPARALELLSTALSEARESGRFYQSAQIAISLGSLLGSTGDLAAEEQVYRQGISDIEHFGSDRAEEKIIDTLARLHGNLGNLLFDNLHRYAEAAVHLRQAATYFEQIGNSDESARRFFQFVRSRLRGGESGSLRFLESGAGLIEAARESFHDILLDGRWALAPGQKKMAAPQDFKAWGGFFTWLLEHNRSQLTPGTERILIAALVLVHAQLREKQQAIILAHDPRFGPLPGTPLGTVIPEIVARLAQESGCYGVLWPLSVGMTDSVDPGTLLLAQQGHYGETAAIQLSDLAWRDHDPGPDPPVIVGIGSISEDPPRWLEVTDPVVLERYRRFRARWPAEVELKEIVFRGGWTAGDGGTEDAANLGLGERLRMRVRAADLLGWPPAMAEYRFTLANWIHRAGEGSGAERLHASTEIIETARSFAQRFPDLLVRADSLLATVLKESLSGDEKSRLDEAIRVARRGFATAERHVLDDQLPAMAITLGNALAEGPGQDPARLDEAKVVLQRGLEALRAQPPGSADHGDFLEGILLNSLGFAFGRSGEAGNVADLREAARFYRLALEIQEPAGDSVRTLSTLGSLLAVLVAADIDANESLSAEVFDLTRRARELAEQIVTTVDLVDMRACSTALINVAKALRNARRPEALGMALAAVAAARPSGPTRHLITVLSSAASMHLSTDKETARTLLEEAVAAIEVFRLDTHESGSRAELSDSFLKVYRSLENVQEELDRPVRERWWTIERRTGRTILEDMHERVVPAADTQVLAVLGEKLPYDTVVLHVYTNWRMELTAYAIDRQGTQVRIRPVGRPVELLEFIGAGGGRRRDSTVDVEMYGPQHGELFRRQLRWLGDRFLGPVMKDLDLSGKSRFIIIPATLSNIPWHAVPLPETGMPLGCVLEVSYVPNAAILGELLARAPHTINNAVFVACDPTGKLGEHIQECRSAFFTLPSGKHIIYTDASRPLTKQIILEAMSKADLFHFAGHSIFASRSPTESGFVLSDGLLTIPEISMMLKGHAPILVFLSSCRSAAVDATMEDQMTLSSVFLRHGAGSVIGSTWQVPDKVAALTARKFYAHLGSDSPGAALTKAHAELIQVFPDGYWSAFRMQGWSSA